MARSVENKLIHIPLTRGMDQSTAPEVAPPGTLYRVVNCRKRGAGALLESRPGLSQLPSTCVGAGTKRYIANNGTDGYVYRPCFSVQFGDSVFLGSTSGEAFAYASTGWAYCGRFSTCLPVRKHTGIAPNSLFLNNTSSKPMFPPQVAVNASGYVMCASLDTNGKLSAYIDSPEGVRQLVAWSSSSTLLRARIVALGDTFYLWWQSAANIRVNSYTPVATTTGVTYLEFGVAATLATQFCYWDVTAGDTGTATQMYLAHGRGDREIFVSRYGAGASLIAGVSKAVGTGTNPVSLFLHPITGNLWLGFNDISGGETGTDTNANVNTSTNHTLRIRADKTQSYTVINVTAGAATAKTTIRTDLNTAFAGAGLALSAVIVGTNQIEIVSTNANAGVPGALVQIDSTANGSNLNTALGFPAAGATDYSGPTFSVFSSTLATVLDYATISAGGTLTLGAPTFGNYRSTAPGATNGAMFSFGEYVATVYTRAAHIGTAREDGTVSANVFMNSAWPVSKPDNYGRIWVLIDSGFIDTSIDASGIPAFLVSRYALLRFFDPTSDSSDPTNVQLLSAPTVELVSEPFVSLTKVLVGSNSSAQRNSDYWSPIVSTPTASYVGIWAGLATVGGQNVATQANTQSAGMIAQAQVLEYTSAEMDRPVDTHRDTTGVSQSIVVAGQPAEFFGQSTARLIYGVTGATETPAYSAGAAEIGFLHPPAMREHANGAASATPAAGSYDYRAVFQWVDTFGRRHQSAPSLPTRVAADGAHAITLNVYTTQYTQRQSRNSAQAVEVVVYRTLAGGTTFHETTMRATLSATLNSRMLVFTDDLADSDISENASLYTDGGVLPNDIAPSCRFTVRSDDRLWFGGLWDPSLIQCSKVIVPDEPIQTSDSVAFQVQLLRPCTGLAYMDGQIIAFAKDAVFLVSGSGPNDQGHGEFSVRTLSETIGCVDYRSIRQTETGVLFQSTEGIKRIARGFAPPEDIDNAIADEMLLVGSDEPREILGTAFVETTRDSLVKFLLRDDSASAGGDTVLLWETGTGEWFVDELTNAAREIGDITRIDSLGIGAGALYASPDFNNSTGTLSPVLYETSTNRFDYPFIGNEPATVEMSVTTAWLTPGGVCGWSKFNKVVGGFKSDAINMHYTLSMRVDSGAIDSSEWMNMDPASVSGVQYRQVIATNPKGTACQIVARLKPDSTSVDPRATAQFVGLTVEIEPDGGARLLSDDERSLSGPALLAAESGSAISAEDGGSIRAA